MSERPSQESNSAGSSDRKLSDENKAWLMICAFLFLLLSVALGVASLLLVLEMDHKISSQKEDLDKVNSTLAEFKEEHDEYWKNISLYLEEGKKTEKELSAKLMSLYRDSGIHIEYHYGATWTRANQYCLDRGYRLCSYKDIFVDGETLFKKIKGLADEEWVPIGDKYNDWAQIGTRTHRAKTYIERNGETPVWGESPGSSDLKRRVFCCLSAFSTKPEEEEEEE